jgi:hypothetical protein
MEMRNWLRKIRDAAVMGIVWAIGWTLFGMLGVVIFYTLHPNAPDIFDIWIPVFAYPGFLGGVIFSVVLQRVENPCRFDEISLPRLTVWGVGIGLLLGMLLFAFGTPSFTVPLWLPCFVIIGSTTLLSILSAIGSALLFRLLQGTMFLLKQCRLIDHKPKREL